MKFFFLFFFLSTAALAAPSDELSVLSKRVSALSTSDDIDIVSATLEWQNHQRNPLWPYANEAPRAVDLGIAGSFNRIMMEEGDFSGYAIQLKPAVKFFPWLVLQTGVGWHTFESEDNREFSDSSYFGLLSVIPSERLSLQIGYENDFAYTSIVHRDLSLALRTESYTARFNYRPWERIQVRANAGFSQLNDGNSAGRGDISLLYGFATATPWWWAGVIAESLSYERDEEAYWSPVDYWAYGAYTEASFPIYGIVSGALAAKVSETRENGGDPGIGTYFSTGLNFGRRDDYLLTVVYEKSDSSSEWSSQSLRVEHMSTF